MAHRKLGLTGSAGGGHQHPGLVIAWRRTAHSSMWEAYVAQVHYDGSALVTWEPASKLAPSPMTEHKVEPKPWRR